MTNYTIVGSRSTTMPIAHPKLKRENKTDRSTKPCSNCGRLDGRPLAVSVLSDLISRVTDAVLEEVPEVEEPTGSDAGAIIAAARAGSTGGRQGEEVGFATDSPVEEAVCCEPVSEMELGKSGFWRSDGKWTHSPGGNTCIRKIGVITIA
jgi:hypothetical protein